LSDRWPRLLSWLLTATLAVLLAVGMVGAPAGPADRATDIGEKIRCPVCQGESIAASPSQLARDMMAMVDDLMAQGLSDDEIVATITAAYPGSERLDPPLSGPTMWLWLLPALALLAGGWAISRMRRDIAVNEPPPPPEDSPAPPNSNRRVIAGAGVLGLVFIGVVVFLAFNRQENPDNGLSGIADAPVDLSEISTESMEAVISANLDHPQILSMRLALADRYFEEGDYQSAFPHYEAVLTAEPSPQLAVRALSHLGWIVFDGNGEVELADSLFDRALEAVPDDPFTLYLKGRVSWCGADDPAQAADLFSRVLGQSGLDPEVRQRVTNDLTAVQSGVTCP
jgi:cytochrome c-type biogenesis protein CcmH/NrfF